MYRHCTFCAADLGTNEVLEPFPVGRRLAFDGARGRLWVICRSCERWNLTPLEERWEAVEEAERIFRDTPLRVSTEQVGLARHREGLDLVRIGEPLRPEFAAWRYGDQFGRRRRRFAIQAAVGVGVVGGVAAGSLALVGGAAVLTFGSQAFQLANLVYTAMQPRIRVPLDSGETLEIDANVVGGGKIRPGPGGDLPGAHVFAGVHDEGASWSLTVDTRQGPRILTGSDAVRTLRAVLPKVNAAGARQANVRSAVMELEEAGGPEAYFAQVEYRARRLGWGYSAIQSLPAPLRLALEMAAHEDAERVALEGELAWLETAWREAEELAAISDALTLPERVRIRFDELKARHGRKPADPESRVDAATGGA